VVDLDPQFNASQYLVGVRGYKRILTDGKPTIWDIFEQHTRIPSGKTGSFETNDAVRNVGNIQGDGKVDLIPSRLELALSLRNPGQKERLLPKALKNLRTIMILS
jgi:chromosome partitioning protein